MLSQDLDLGIMIILRLRCNNVFSNTGRNRNIHRSSEAQQVPSAASIWPIVRKVKIMVIGKKTTFGYAVL